MKKITTLLSLLLISVMGIAQTDCSELFFSEYIEGSSNNKAIEIYNPTNDTIDLSNYEVLLFSNAATQVTNSLTCKGMLAPGEVYIIANSQSDKRILDVTDTTSSVTYFNGDDAVVLYNTNTSDTTDIIGEVGIKTTWSVGSGSTKDFTIVRKSTVKAGNTNWTIASTEWDVYPKDTFQYLGAHTNDCQSGSSGSSDTTMISFEKAFFDIDENASQLVMYVKADSIGGTDKVAVTLDLTGGNATEGTDFAYNSIELTLDSANLKDSFVIIINEDPDVEGNETIELMASISGGVANLNYENIVVTIIDNDFALVSIKELKEKDIDGNFMLEDSTVKIGGVVHGPSFQTSNIEFRLYDGTDAVVAFEFDGESVWGPINDGDSIVLVGNVTEYNGLTQFRFGDKMDTIEVLSKGHDLMIPSVVDSIYEGIESHLVTMKGLSLSSVDFVSGSGGNYWLQKANGDSLLMRLDADVPAWGWADSIPAKFDIIGFVGQFNDYQITPRYMSDIMPLVTVGVSKVASIDAEVYPNPSTGLFTINSDKVENIRVFNLLGSEILFEAGTQGNRAQIDLSAAKNGIYLVQFTANGSTVTRKIVKK